MYFDFRVTEGNITENGEITIKDGVYTVWDEVYVDILYEGPDMIKAINAYMEYGEYLHR